VLGLLAMNVGTKKVYCETSNNKAMCSLNCESALPAVHQATWSVIVRRTCYVCACALVGCLLHAAALVAGELVVLCDCTHTANTECSRSMCDPSAVSKTSC